MRKRLWLAALLAAELGPLAGLAKAHWAVLPAGAWGFGLLAAAVAGGLVIITQAALDAWLTEEKDPWQRHWR